MSPSHDATRLQKRRRPPPDEPLRATRRAAEAAESSRSDTGSSRSDRHGGTHSSLRSHSLVNNNKPISSLPSSQLKPVVICLDREEEEEEEDRKVTLIDLTVVQRPPPKLPVVDLTLPSAAEEKKDESSLQAAADAGKLRAMECAVCLDTVRDMTATTCGHVFCLLCIQGWIRARNQCPICRKRLTLRSIHRLYL